VVVGSRWDITNLSLGASTMIRIEGIPIVAARLAAMQKAATAIEPSRPVRAHRRQKPRAPMASTSARMRRSRANTQVCE